MADAGWFTTAALYPLTAGIALTGTGIFLRKRWLQVPALALLIAGTGLAAAASALGRHRLSMWEFVIMAATELGLLARDARKARL